MTQEMRLVIVESPYNAPTEQGIAANVAYARRAVVDCLYRNESPIASHLLFTQENLLDDKCPAERFLGIRAGLEWYRVAACGVVYLDHGLSQGMREGIERANSLGVRVDYRRMLYRGKTIESFSYRSLDDALNGVNAYTCVSRPPQGRDELGKNSRSLIR